MSPTDGRSVAERDEFMEALAWDLPAEERMILCGFNGDPDKVVSNAWKPRPWRPGRDVTLSAPQANAYITVASFGRAGDGSFRRRTETFAAGRALMVDDVGTKVDLSAVRALVPSARVETSKGNEQWWYFLREPETSMPRFDGVIRAFITGKLLGADPGMSGVTRVGRLPAHINGKPARGGWICRLRELTPARYAVEELLDAFGLKINGQRIRRDPLPTEAALQRNEAYGVTFRWLQDRGMLKRAAPDVSGWTEMRCPWTEEHTGAADTGAALREPSPENEWYGAFRCHHGHCVDRGWAELNDWIAEESANELDEANK